MPLCYSIAYGVIAGCCSYIVLYLGNFLLDLIGVALGKDNMQNVLYNNCPDAFQDKMKVPVPFKSPSAVLQVCCQGCSSYVACRTSTVPDCTTCADDRNAI
jgi:xanthine/uracil/vitamin C permease (AzgA family)